MRLGGDGEVLRDARERILARGGGLRGHHLLRVGAGVSGRSLRGHHLLRVRAMVSGRSLRGHHLVRVRV